MVVYTWIKLIQIASDLPTLVKPLLLLFQSPAIESPNTSIAAKFLEEEDKRSQRLLKQLDMHIDELKIESERTVDKFVWSADQRTAYMLHTMEIAWYDNG